VPAVWGLAVMVSLATIVAALLPAGRGPALRGGAAAAWLLLLFFAVPLVAVWGWSFIRQPVYLVGRYDTIVLPVFLLLFAGGLDRMLRANRWAAYAVALFAAGFSAAAVQASIRTPVPDSDDLARRRLVPDAAPGDQIVATGYRRAVIEYYLARAGRRPTLWSFPSEIGEHPGWSSPARMLDDRAALVREASALGSQLRAAVAAGHKVWLLGSGSNAVDDYLFRALTANRLNVDESRSDPAAGVMRLMVE
jgi:hypothetical protein